MKLTRQTLALILLAAGAALMWWRQRASAQSGGLSADLLAQYKNIVSAFNPEGATVNERTLADSLPFAADSLSKYGLGGYVESADGRLIVTSDKDLAEAITAAKNPGIPTAQTPEEPRTTVQKYLGGQYYWYYSDSPKSIHWGIAPNG